MKSIATSLIIALGGMTNAAAQTQPASVDHAQHPQPATKASALDVPAAAQPAVAVVERFGKALAAGDFKTVEALLDAEVLILETGGAERSRQEYLAHHAISDAKFLKGSHHQLIRRRARIAGDLVWVGSESELHASKDGKPLALLSTETMVLKKTGDYWRIVHIHWSSRPKPVAKAVQAPPPRSSALHVQRQGDADDDDTAALLAGAGAGQSMVAERRGVPGPRHVLDLADALALTPAQRDRIDTVHRDMQQAAIGLGKRIVAAEARLDALFSAHAPEAAALQTQLANIASLRAQLRQVHLQAHLTTAPMLTDAQRSRYVTLRGHH